MPMHIPKQHVIHRPIRCCFRARGSANAAALMIGGSALAAAVLIALALTLRGEGPLGGEPEAGHGDPLIVYCAAGFRQPMEALVADYNELYPDAPIELQPGGSGKLYGTIQAEAASGAEGRADLYLSAEWNFFDRGREEGLIDEVIPIGTQHPVLIVQRGNPGGIESLADLVAEDAAFDFGIASPGAAIGNVTRDVAQSLGLWEALRARRKTEAQTVTELAGAVQSGALDAAVVWNTTATMYDRVEVVTTAESELSQAVSGVGLSVISSSKRPAQALRFARFVTSRDRGLPAFAEIDVDVAHGDIWEERPEVLFYAGSMFHAVIDDTVHAFAEREGVDITTIYAGCGDLVNKMNVPGADMPDAYMSCDQEFMDMVDERFGEQALLSTNEIVIAVKKGNPLDIQSVHDLLERDGVRLGICDPDRSALGRLTKIMLDDDRFGGIYDEIEALRQIDSAKGPDLVATMIGGGLDAVIVYRSNVESNPDNLKHHVEIVPIDDGGSGLAQAAQPWAIARNADHPQLMARLFEEITAARSRHRFEDAGFLWQYGER